MKAVEQSETAILPTKYGTFNIQAFKDDLGKEHLAIYTDNLSEAPIVRVHSECLTGDALGSLKCDCGEQLHAAMKLIAKEGGMIIYHRQEGRNIGLLNKVNAYALQDQGFDTVAANHQLGFQADERTYDIVEFILNHFGIKKLRLLTNNPKKIESLKNIEIIERIPIQIASNPHNEGYLKTKKEQMGHLL
ncbi:MAG: GTP cyclohydrolase II [Campylobacterales bacterium]|nr:GTP cyclohydrolase II [Campylobacterales bacterium]